LCTNGFAQAFQLGVIAGVMPGDDRRHRLATSVEQHSRLGNAGDTEAADRPRWAVGQRLGDGGFGGVEQSRRIELGA
jgi:hypothetical protein